MKVSIPWSSEFIGFLKLNSAFLHRKLMTYGKLNIFYAVQNKAKSALITGRRML